MHQSAPYRNAINNNKIKKKHHVSTSPPPKSIRPVYTVHNIVNKKRQGLAPAEGACGARPLRPRLFLFTILWTVYTGRIDLGGGEVDTWCFFLILLLLSYCLYALCARTLLHFRDWTLGCKSLSHFMNHLIISTEKSEIVIERILQRYAEVITIVSEGDHAHALVRGIRGDSHFARNFERASGFKILKNIPLRDRDHASNTYEYIEKKKIRILLGSRLPCTQESQSQEERTTH